MKWIYIVMALLLVLLAAGCVPRVVPEAPPTAPPEAPPTIDWSEVSIPAIGEGGKWVLAPGMGYIVNAVFSSDGKTIYGLGSNSHHHTFLRKSNDGGQSWVTLPAFEELGLCEAFFMELVNDELFIGSATYGIYHSIDGGKTFDKLPPTAADPGIWQFDVTVDASGKPVVMAGIATGLWMLSYPYEKWVDMRVGNADSGSGYIVWQMAFSPNYAEDKQIMALVSDGHHLKVTFKYGDEAWGERIADAYIPDTETYCDLSMVFSRFAFLDDYDSQNPVVFIGAGLLTEVLYKTPQYADLYRIDGKPAGSGPSITTDLDVGGEGTSTPVYSVITKGPANNGTILAGSVSQVYRSTDGGHTWQVAKKSPTGGAIFWMAFDPSGDENPLVYCSSTEAGNCTVPRGADVPVRESAFSGSADGGVTWNQVSQIDTTIDEALSGDISPDYNKDKTLFMLTRSRHSLTLSFTEDEMVNVTREPDEPGVSAKVYITPHQANPPSERMRIGYEDFATGTGPILVLDNECPSVSLKVLPLLETDIREFIDQFKEFLPQYTDPWYAEQWLALCQQPRQALIYVIEGSVTVTKDEAIEDRISVDGDARDWQGIEPLATDPEGDAPSKDVDMKAFYATNDSGYLYLMVEFYGQNPRSHCDILLNIDLDGSEDLHINIVSPDEPFGPMIGLYKLPSSECLGNGVVAFGQVLEARLPLKVIDVERFRITQINIAGWTGQDLTHGLDRWEDSLEVKIEEFAAPAPVPSSPPIPFPSTESLWKTIDGGNTWERILTSGLKLLVDGKEAQIGPLASVVLSDNFAQDNTLFVYEGGDNSKIWVSNDGGATFRLHSGTTTPPGKPAPPLKLQNGTTTSPGKITPPLEPEPEPPAPPPLPEPAPPPLPKTPKLT